MSSKAVVWLGRPTGQGTDVIVFCGLIPPGIWICSSLIEGRAYPNPSSSVP